jgi:hypothetical protein
MPKAKGVSEAMWSSSVLKRFADHLKMALPVLTTLAVTGWGAASAYDEPAYDFVERHEQYEVRQYEPYIVAEVEVREKFEDVGDEAFRILFDFISGKNTRQEKISMTAPVSQQPSTEAGEKIEMTSPVLKEQDPSKAEAYRFSFVMPASYTVETLPRPKDPRINIRQVPAKLVAARRYSGSWSETNYRKNERILLEALQARGIQTQGAPAYARYNSPFSLWFMRRNEVLVEIDR